MEYHVMSSPIKKGDLSPEQVNVRIASEHKYPQQVSTHKEQVDIDTKVYHLVNDSLFWSFFFSVF